jgi:hypothetical protein
MKKRSLIDEMRALAAGSLTSGEERRLRARCETDPESQALLEDILEVYALTASGDVEPPPCRLEFSGVMGALAPHRARRAVLRRFLRVAAAVLVLVGLGALVSQLMPGKPGGGEIGRELVLLAIPLDAEQLPDSGPEIPEILASYRPVADGRIQWIESMETALAMSRVSSRPVLLFLHHPTCPSCKQMIRQTFTDVDVRTRMDGFVPALVDVRHTTKEVLEKAREGWPWLGALDADGQTILAFPGVRGPADFSDSMREAAKRAGPTPFAWERLNELRRRLEEADRAFRAEDLAAARDAYLALAADETAGVFREAGKYGVDRIGMQAYKALTVARELAARKGGSDTAILTLDGEIRRFAGSPYAEDLRKVRRHLQSTGRFPRLD